jgi:hypothetical protein
LGIYYFGLDDLSVGESAVLMSSTIVVLGSICPFVRSNICFIKLCVLMFSVYEF